VDASDAQGLKISTAFTGARRELSDAALLAAFLRQPLMTLKVVAGIGWGALRVWLKGVAYRPRPAPPAQATTVVEARRRRAAA
jgi:DUF1365 family protein